MFYLLINFFVMNVKFIIGLFTVFGLFLFNISIDGNKSKESNVALLNVGLMQANAAEMWCDQSTNSECTITSSGGTVGKSTGKLFYER